MSPKIDLPEGLKAQEIEGPGKLQPLLKKLKRYSFQGYLKISVRDEFEGYLVLKEGLPRNALFYDLKEDEQEKGLPALQQIHALNSNPNLYISVHTDLDIDELIEKVGGKLPARGVEKTGTGKTPTPDKPSEMFKQQTLERSEGALSDLSEEVKEDFLERYSFRNFIVGPNNRFAYTAALSVAENPDESYNPLFITSKTGLGKTHLLKAIGRAQLIDDKDRKVKYVVTSKLLNEIEESEKEDQMSDLREKYLDTETLLLDDVQSLANKEHLQEEFFYILSELQSKGGLIVLSADRSPEDLPQIEDHLISRFRSGLVVDILAPSYETRKKIVEFKAEREGHEIPEDVVNYMAKKIRKNVSSIEGALNRVTAYSSLLDKPITLETMEDVLTRYIDKEIDTGERLKPQFKPGRSYIVEEETTPSEGLSLLDELPSRKQKFVLSRMNPEQIKDEYELKNSEIAWLTDRKSEEQPTIPPNLERLSWTLEEQIKSMDVVFIDGLEYLISNTSFDASIQFIRHIVDVVSETDTVFVLVVNPKALESKEISILEREMDVISYVS
ncbi:MAG: DnaA/Hda family protein [Candidatus Thermoplasmatota archaeon]